MRGLDTNILLRYLTADDPAQTERVGTLFAAAEQTGERFFISVIAWSECEQREEPSSWRQVLAGQILSSF